jgi:hypothetical protein
MSESNGTVSGNTVFDTATEYKKSGPEINIEVSFRIIKQFSKELYDNSRRAIEELVCNSYDAGAKDCYIKTPEGPEDDLKVLDNGESMDFEGLEWLWKVAESRKVEELDEDRIKHGRQQIGKFGVGKLASFALGGRLTHMATRGDTARVVSVHQQELKEAGPNTSGNDEEDEDTVTVREFDREEAKEIFSHHFDDIPNPWEEEWETWTLAVVNDIPPENTGNDLQPWHLKRMIPAALPSATKFTTYLNQEEIEDKEPPADIKFSIDVTEESFIENVQGRLQRYWADKLSEEEDNVDSSLYEVEQTTFENPGDISETLAGINVPKLGHVHGKGDYFEKKVTTEKREERNYLDHGFRIYVRGRLLNKNDISFGLDNLSHKIWIRFRAELEIPGLDDDLRVQRDSTKDSTEVDMAKEVARAMFNEIRREADQRREDERSDQLPDSGSTAAGTDLDRPFSDRLQMRSPWYASHAIGGLIQQEGTEVNIDDVEIEVRSLRSTDHAIEFDEEDSVFVVNDAHPLFDTLEKKDGFTKNLQDAFSEILAARLLIHGYLRSMRTDPDALAASRQIFDSVLRSAAGSIGEDELSYQLAELNDASIEGDTRYEQAIVDIFQNIGLAAVQEGGPDTHDGVLVIPRSGQSNCRISIEAKGSQGIVDHQQLKFDNINRHRVEQDCDHAIVVARNFQTEGRGNKKSALLRNADQEINHEAVEHISFMTNDALEVFLRLHYEQPFTYSETIEIFTNNKIPSHIADHVVSVWESKPDDQIVRTILELAHEFMEDDPTNPPAVDTITSLPNGRGIPREEVIARVEALDRLSESVDFQEDSNIIKLDAPPEVILEEIDEAEVTADPILEEADLEVLEGESNTEKE